MRYLNSSASVGSPQSPLRRPLPRLIAGAITGAVAVVTWLLIGTLLHPAWAGPGAHGPNGEHLDAPAGAAVAGIARPRIEAQSELFELVGTLEGGELSIWIDRFASNEPVLQAQVEVESEGLKARAHFHADLGDYAVTDVALIKKLAQPGEHPLVVTVIAGDDMDLLEGQLQPPAAGGHEDAHAHGWPRYGLGLAALGLLVGAGLAAWQVYRRRAGGVGADFQAGGRA